MRIHMKRGGFIKYIRHAGLKKQVPVTWLTRQWHGLEGTSGFKDFLAGT